MNTGNEAGRANLSSRKMLESARGCVRRRKTALGTERTYLKGVSG